MGVKSQSEPEMSNDENKTSTKSENLGIRQVKGL